MADNHYRQLPLSTLQDLLFAAVQEMLDAFDRNDPLALKSKVKQVELIHHAIAEVKKMMFSEFTRP